MKRTLTVLTVALLMVALVVVLAAPAFAAQRKAGPNHFIYHGSDTTGKFDKRIHH